MANRLVIALDGEGYFTQLEWTDAEGGHSSSLLERTEAVNKALAVLCAWGNTEERRLVAEIKSYEHRRRLETELSKLPPLP